MMRIKTFRGLFVSRYNYRNVLCSTCKIVEAKEGQRVCSGCHAGYMRSYRRTIATRAIRAAKREGGEKFKAQAVRLFQGILDREMNGLTVAAIIEDMAV